MYDVNAASGSLPPRGAVMTRQITEVLALDGAESMDAARAGAPGAQASLYEQLRALLAPVMVAA